ncbi:helix-turn-helix domain-containing protein, partial [Escherichia coli]|uniref:helix-turn-helix domain-containing protein n=1 Tax=Escherichia coli TaxID=562 RepID=UPI0032DB4F6D
MTRPSRDPGWDKKEGDRLRKEVPQAQLATVSKEVIRGAKLAFQLAEAQAGDPKVKERLRKLKQVEAFRKHGVSWPEIQELLGISRATYYRWRKRLKEEGLAGLKPRSRRPQRLRRRIYWSSDLLIRVEALRKENP